MAFERMKAAAKDPAPLLRAVGLLMVGKTQSAFTEQGRRGMGRWPERGVPNRAGILEDLRGGGSPPERRWDPRPAALDTGRLRSSIAFRVEGNRVVIGSSLPYASDVQRGSSKTIQLEGGIRKALTKWLRSLRGDRKKQAGRAFGPVLRAGSLSVKVPPRPFLVFTAADRSEVMKLAQNYFGGGYAK